MSDTLTLSLSHTHTHTQLQSLDAKNFVSMLSLVLSHLLGVMSRAATVHELLLVSE